MPYQILDYRDVPNPIAKKVLENYLSKVQKFDMSADLARSALEYLQSLPLMCNPEKAEELVDKLKKEYKLGDTTIALIINMVPETLDELRMLLAFETVVPEEEVQHKVLELVKEYCK